MKTIAEQAGINLSVIYQSTNFREYEHPTLLAIWEHATQEQDSAILYLHTKGVSHPNDACKRQWRRVMQRYLIADWRQNHMALAEYDFVGANWQDSASFPHYQGNFWMARCDWIAHLQNPAIYRAQNRHIVFAGQAWDRMHAELWLGSRPWHHLKSLVCVGHQWWKRKEDTDYVYKPIDGFDYELP